MSKISLAPNISGSAVYTIASPAGSTDRTLTLPDTTAPILAGSGITLSASAPANTLVTTDAGNVGIGTSSPARNLEIFRATQASMSVIGANSGTIVGQRAEYGAIIELQNTDTTVGSLSGIWGRRSGDTEGSAALVFQGQGANQQQNMLFLTAGAERMRIDSAGALILVGSTAQKATGTTWSNPSDERLKDNIRDYGKGIAELMQVRVREWEYNGKGGTVEGTKGLGVVADEVMVVLPDTVETYEAKLNADDEEVTAIKKFDATEITWLLVKSIQELNAKVNAQAAEIAALKGQA